MIWLFDILERLGLNISRAVRSDDHCFEWAITSLILVLLVGCYIEMRAAEELYERHWYIGKTIDYRGLETHPLSQHTGLAGSSVSGLLCAKLIIYSYLD